MENILCDRRARGFILAEARKGSSRAATKMRAREFSTAVDLPHQRFNMLNSESTHEGTRTTEFNRNRYRSTVTSLLRPQCSLCFLALSVLNSGKRNQELSAMRTFRRPNTAQRTGKNCWNLNKERFLTSHRTFFVGAIGPAIVQAGSCAAVPVFGIYP